MNAYVVSAYCNQFFYRKNLVLFILFISTAFKLNAQVNPLTNKSFTNTKRVSVVALYSPAATCQVEIYDLREKLLSTITINGTENKTIDISNLPERNLFYFIQKIIKLPAGKNL